MGDQDLSDPFDEIKKKFSRVNIKIDEDLYEAAKNFPKRPRISSSLFWQTLGIKKTDRLDIEIIERNKNDNFGKVFKLDLNYPLNDQNLIEKYDLVTDFGNNEHPFNVVEAYRTMHKLCKKNGFMFIEQAFLHGNGFYNFDTSFFENIAAVNNYTIIHSCLTFEFENNYFSTPVDKDFVKHINFRDLSSIGLIYCFRKNNSKDFQIPYQGSRTKTAVEEYYKMDYVYNDKSLEKSYLPVSIDQVSTIRLLKKIISRIKNKVFRTK